MNPPQADTSIWIGGAAMTWLIERFNVWCQEWLEMKSPDKGAYQITEFLTKLMAITDIRLRLVREHPDHGPEALDLSALNLIPVEGVCQADIAGDCTENILWRLDHGQVAGLHPKMVALMIGTNNTGNLDAAQIAEGITADVHAYRKALPDAIILLQAMLPRSESPTDPVWAKIKSVNEIIVKLAGGKKVIYVDFGDKFLSPDGTISRDIMADFLHPTPQGYRIWAEAIRPEIEKVFGPTKPAGN